MLNKEVTTEAKIQLNKDKNQNSFLVFEQDNITDGVISDDTHEIAIMSEKTMADKCVADSRMETGVV